MSGYEKRLAQRTVALYAAGPAKAVRKRHQGRHRADPGAKRPHPPLGGADAWRWPQRPRHRADPVGLARLLRLAGPRRPGRPATRCRTCARPSHPSRCPRRWAWTTRCNWPSMSTKMPTPGWRRAMPPWSSCCTAAACAWASWWGWTWRRQQRPRLDLQAPRRMCWARAASAAVPVGARRWRACGAGWRARPGGSAADGDTGAQPRCSSAGAALASRRSPCGSA
jgi:hypothetical protein